MWVALYILYHKKGFFSRKALLLIILFYSIATGVLKSSIKEREIIIFATQVAVFATLLIKKTKFALICCQILKKQVKWEQFVQDCSENS